VQFWSLQGGVHNKKLHEELLETCLHSTLLLLAGAVGSQGGWSEKAGSSGRRARVVRPKRGLGGVWQTQNQNSEILCQLLTLHWKKLVSAGEIL